MKTCMTWITRCVGAFMLAWLAAAPAWAAEPVGITSIELRAGLVTAVDGARTRTIQFKVTDAALLRALRVGQIVLADLGAKNVRIQSATPCCAIVNVQTDAPGSQTGVVGNASMNAPGDPFGGSAPPRRVTKDDYPSCNTCVDACKVCAEWNQECRCTQIASGSSPGPEDDVWSCHCTGPNPKTPVRK